MIGRTLRNRYEVQELIGEGSTATVYKGLDRRLNRVVALKVLLPHVRETARKRFLQEATSVAALNHPHIMAIYDMDDEGDLHFLVVEFVEGEALSRYIPSQPEAVGRLGAQLADALGYAHEKQIVHRDIKPANIKVTPGGMIKVMDLGLALPREAKRVTADGMIIGTPAYLSPEQAQGLTLDYRTDLYSLGVVLYEMATGELPFDSDDIPSLLLQHVRDNPTPPRQLRPEIPMALEMVILKALEKNPARRFQSGQAMAQALLASVRGEHGQDLPTQATPSTGSLSNGIENAPAVSAVLRLVLADDHTMLRKALVTTLSHHDELMVVAEAGDGEMAIERVMEFQPDVLLLDLNMPIKSGLEALPIIRKQAPNVRVLVLTGRNEDWYITQALRAGAHGYLLKSADEADLVDAIKKVSEGRLVLGQGVTEAVLGLARIRTDRAALEENEREILLMVAAGLENPQIATRLGLTMPQTIEALAHAMDKLGAKDRHAAALAALRTGEILIDELHLLDPSS